MTVREKMIEVIHESEMACDDAVRLADRLHAAGFVCFNGEKLTIRQAVECDNGNLWVRWPE